MDGSVIHIFISTCGNNKNCGHQSHVNMLLNIKSNFIVPFLTTFWSYFCKFQMSLADPRGH